MCLLILCMCLCLLQQNAGAEHKGKFSRLTYFYSPTGKANSFPVSVSSSFLQLLQVPPCFETTCRLIAKPAGSVT